ncbi:MAG: hypothetical protein AAF265_00610 [Pseudomonadota bacterium]
MKSTRFTLLAAVAAAAVVACGGKPSSSANELLSYVPADTPYLFAALEPQPKALKNKFQPMIDMAIDQYSGMFEQARNALVENAKDDSASDLITVLDVLIEETADGDLSDFGFSSDKDVPVFYGNGLLPVLRMTVSSMEDWQAAYGRLTGDLENGPATITVDGLEIDVLGGEAPVQVFIAEQDNMLVISLGPKGMAEKDIGMLLGTTKPDSSLADAGTLSELAERYSFLPQMQGFLDLQQVFAMITTEGNALNDVLFDVAPNLPLQLDETCRNEMAGLFEIAPRAVVGATRLDGDGSDTLSVLELRSDVATALKPIANVMPGLTADTDSALKFGGALDLQNLRTWVETTLGGVVEAPFECAQLAGLNEISAQAFEVTQQPLPPAAYSFQGYSVEIGSLEGLEGLAQQQVPENLEIDVTFGVKNVQGLLMLGQMFVPQLAQLPLDPNGEGVALPQDLTGPLPVDGFMAMTRDLISVSVGENAKSRVEANVAATAGDANPLIGYFNVDAGAYFNFVSTFSDAATESILQSDEIPESERALVESQQARMQAMAEAYEELFDRLDVRFELTDRGIEVPARATFK